MNTNSAPAGRDILELAAGYAEESVIVTDANLEAPGPEILYVNTAFTRMTGFGAAELIGQSPRLMQGPETDRVQLDNLKHELRAGNDFIARTTNYRRDGTPFELEWIITHLRNEVGETTHFVAVQRDITGIERAESALEAIDAELTALGHELIQTLGDLRRAERQMLRADRMNALGRMARGVSHDLANSLAPMTWLLDQIEADEGLGEPGHNALRSLRANVDHALTLHRHLADFAGTSDDGERVAISADELVDGIVDLASSHQTRTGSPIEVTLLTDPGLTLTGNPVELRQVIVNLALNAVDAMPDGGTLDISVHDGGDEVAIAIADSGVGMEPDIVEHCFEPFFTTRSDGTGLGLAICHGVVASHGGRIDVSTQPGVGSTFTITLPR